MLGAGDADGMVPVSSARHSSAVSEKFIHAKHTNVNKYPEAVEELFCVLRRHLQELGPATNSVPIESVNFSD